MITSTSGTTCQYCGLIHSGVCPRIKSIEYHENGTIKRVEFHEPQKESK